MTVIHFVFIDWVGWDRDRRLRCLLFSLKRYSVPLSSFSLSRGKDARTGVDALEVLPRECIVRRLSLPCSIFVIHCIVYCTVPGR